MALSANQKQQTSELLAAGKTATQAADTVDCNCASVQRVKHDPKFSSLMQIASGMARTKQLSEQGGVVIATLNALKEREP